MLNVSNEFLSKIKEGSRTVSASIGYDDIAMTNGIVNGNFSNGANGWTLNGANTTVSGLNNVATLTVVTPYSYGGIYRGVPLVTGNKYYIRYVVKPKYANSCRFGLDNIALNVPTTANVDNVLSMIQTSTLTSASYPVSFYHNTLTSYVAGDTYTLKQMMCIDLTAIYGVGNEPSKDYMDALMAKVGFIDGTKNVPSQFLGDRTLVNKITNGNFATLAGYNGYQYTATVANNKATVSATATNTSHYFETPITPVVGHKFYCSCNVDTIVNCRVNLQMNNRKVMDGYDSYATPSTSTNAYLSGIITPSSLFATPYLGVRIELYDINSNPVFAGTNQAVNVSNFMAIDLTEIYGAGNEPTQAYMDSLIATSGWFNRELLLEDSTILCDFNIDSSLGNSNLPSIGSTISNKLTLSIINDKVVPQTLIGKALRPYVGLDIGNGVYEWVKLGKFYADYDGIDIGKLETTLEAFDNMASYMDVTYTASAGLTMTVQGVINDLATNYGVTFANQVSKNLYNPETHIEFDGFYRAYATGVKSVSVPTYSLKIPVQPNTTYVKSTDVLTNNIAYWTSGFTYISGVATATTFTTPANCYFVTIAIVKPYGWFQLEVGSVATSYVPYGLQNPALKVVPTGSIRQVISDMASLISTNATMDGDGNVKFVFMNTVASGTFSLGLDNYSEFKLQPDSMVSLTELILDDGSNQVPWGNTSGYALAFKNVQVKELPDVKVVYNRIFPVDYYAYTMKAQGMPHVELGDVIPFTYLKLDGTQATINIPIIKHKFTFKGAFTSEFSASAPTQSTTSVAVTSGSSVADAVDVSYADLQEAIEISSKQITGNKGGFITTLLNSDNQPQEIIISNTPDYNTADKVWRWNASGLAFGTSYLLADGLAPSLALTADGYINASKVTVGTMDANLIKAGVIRDVKNQSYISMVDGTFNFGNGRLVWDGSAFTINFANTSVETALNGKVDDGEFSPFKSNISFDNGIISLGKADSPFSVNVTNQAVEFIDDGTTGGALNLTAITGNATSVTCTYASQAVIPYQVGGYSQISGCSVSAYNGTWKITSCTKTQVVLECTATGTVSTGFGVIQYGSSPNTVAYINGQKMYISNLQATDTIQVGNHQIFKYNSTITLVKFAG